MPDSNKVTAQGNQLTLEGSLPSIGSPAPQFTALNSSMQPVSLEDFKNELVIISAVPSLDTKVCELQTIRFNQEADKLKAKVITISMDLPFAQKRFCDAHKIENSVTLSDFKDRDFAYRYGLYIKELGLIARSVFLIDRDGRLAYMEIVKDISEQPDYDRLLDEAKNLGA